MFLCDNQAKKKNTLVSGNVGDKKYLHPGGRKKKTTPTALFLVEKQRALSFIV